MKLSKWTFSTICITEKIIDTILMQTTILSTPSKMEYSYASKAFMCSSTLKSFKPTIIDGFIYK